MLYNSTTPAIAFSGAICVGQGTLEQVALAAKAIMSTNTTLPLLVFESETGRPIDLDLRGTTEDVLARLAPSPAAKPGRPKLGVVAREVTLLPRHWDWLAAQPGGASIALRKLVEAAHKEKADSETQRLAAEASYRFISAIAGDFPQFEEASRALFAGDMQRYGSLIELWPLDIAAHARKLAGQTKVPPSTTA